MHNNNNENQVSNKFEIGMRFYKQTAVDKL